MMSLFDLLLLAIALAMDCFTVSIVSGVMVRRSFSLSIVRMALLFGAFQALMPLTGWLATANFSQYIESIGHWIAFLLLLFIGGKMVKESLDDEADSPPSLNPLLLRTQLLLAIATSIDALAVGISFTCVGYTHITQLAMPLFTIGMASLLLSLFGYWLGMRFGRIIARRLRPELMGGLILIFIGLKQILG